MNRRNAQRLDEWPVASRPEPFRMTAADHARNVAWIVGPLVLVVLLVALWMGAVIEAVPA